MTSYVGGRCSIAGKDVQKDVTRPLAVTSCRGEMPTNVVIIFTILGVNCNEWLMTKKSKIPKHFQKTIGPLDIVKCNDCPLSF